MASTSPSPYIGLRPFSSAEAAFFFGREDERRVLAANLTGARLTVLYGPSGVGKSSVLDGGIVPDLAQSAKRRPGAPRFAAAYFRDWSKWRHDPLAGVTEAIHEHLARDYGIELNGGSTQDFQATLRAWMDTQPGGLLIILDQMEEYLLYHDGEAGGDSFARGFPKALDDPDLRVNFLLALRDDALARLDRFKGQLPHLLDNRLQLDLLSRRAARDAILRPLKEFHDQGLGEAVIEDKLVEAVLDKVSAGRVKLGTTGEGELPESHAAAGRERPIEAPYLQLVMERLWNEERGPEEEQNGPIMLRLETFKRLGWAQRIIQDHLDSRMARFPEADQEVAAKVFQYLVTPSGAKIALSAYDLAHSARVPEQQVVSVLEGLARGDSRIVRSIASPIDAPQEPRYEIFHDALARAILDWTGRRQKSADERKLRDAEARLRRELREKRLARAVAAVLGACVLALIVSLLLQNQKTRLESQARGLAAEAARGLRDDPERSLLVSLHAAALTFGPYDSVLPEVAEALHRALQSSRARHIMRHEALVNAVAVSSDGSILATGDVSGRIVLWDAAAGRELRGLPGHTREVRRLAFSPDGTSLASASADSTARIWFLKAERDPLVLRGHTGGVEAVAFHPSGKWLLTGSTDKTARIWDAVSGRPGRVFLGHTDSVSAVAFTSSGNRILTGSWDHTARVWELATGRQHCSFTGHWQEVYDVVVLPSVGAELAATASRDQTARIWNVDSCTELRRLRAHHNSIFSVAADQSGTFLATASADGTVKVWRAESGNVAFELIGHSQPVFQVEFSPDGRQLYTASWDSTARVWDASPVMSELEVLQQESEDHLMRAVAFNPKRLQLAAIDQEGAVLVSDLRRPRRSYRRTIGDQVYALSFSPDGSRFAVGGQSRVRVFDAGTGDLLRQLDPATLEPDTIGGIMAVAFNPDGDLVALGGTTGLVAIWKLADSTTSVLRGHHDRVNTVVFSPEGDRLVTGSNDGTALVWDLQQGRVDTVQKRSGWVTAAAFSPKGDLLATAGSDHLIHVTSMGHDRETQTLEGPNNTVWSIAFSPDGRRLASSNFDGTARVWDLSTGREVLWLQGHSRPAYGVAYSQDGKYLASSGEDGEVHVSIIDHAALLVHAWGHVNRSLTPQECWRLLRTPSCTSAAAAVAEGHRFARAGDVAEASTKFAEARDLDPTFRLIDPDSLARALAVDARIERGLAHLRGKRLSEAMDEFRRAEEADQSRARSRDFIVELAHGIADILQSGDTSLVGPALAAYREAKSWSGDFEATAETLNSMCWWGTLGGHAQDVLEVCEAAVKASPDDGNIRDSRGVNRALMGNMEGALEDFRAFVASSVETESRARRERWIHALKLGRDPFTPGELADLRRE